MTDWLHTSGAPPRTYSHLLRILSDRVAALRHYKCVRQRLRSIGSAFRMVCLLLLRPSYSIQNHKIMPHTEQSSLGRPTHAHIHTRAPHRINKIDGPRAAHHRGLSRRFYRGTPERLQMHVYNTRPRPLVVFGSSAISDLGGGGVWSSQFLLGCNDWKWLRIFFSY